MDIAPVFIYVLPIVILIAIGLLGGTRRIGFWPAVILSILLTPIGGFILTLLSGPKRPKKKKRKKRAQAPERAGEEP
jgi:UPF0716 family protein affecting phage T7 exclusion